MVWFRDLRFGFLFGIAVMVALMADAHASVLVEKTQYRGWPNSYRISNGTVELIVLADVGPRIISYNFAGEGNEFHEVPEQLGKTGGTEFHGLGGHRLWVSPEVERTYFPDNRQVEVVREGSAVRFRAPVEGPPVGTDLQKEMEIRLDDTGTHVTITHRIFNRGAIATEMAPWGLSMMHSGGRAILPFPPKAPTDPEHLLPVGVMAVWSYTDFADPRWKVGTRYLQLRQDPHPKGVFREQMGGIYNPAGWGAYYREGHLFVKRAAVVPHATYPDFGCNFEVYTDPGFLELETLGPLRRLNPGDSAVHVEQWWLYKDVPAGEGEDWIETTIRPVVERTAE